MTNHLYKVSYDVRILSTEMTDNSGNPVTTGGAWMVYQSGKRVPDTNGFNMDYPGYHMENIPIGSWQHVEYYYLHQFKTFGDKENDTLIRVYPTGHQNHASNVTFDIDAISMTDLGLAANADFEIGAKENVCIDLGVSLSTQNVLGWTQNGAVSSASSDTRPGSTGKQSMEVAVTETGGMVYRGIAPVNGVTYKIGFWAKGKALSAETPFALVFDRTVPESGGDTESYIVPDYQYITGKNEINETKSFGTWKLTNDWQYFECVVSNTFPLKEGLTEPNANTFPRLPFLYLDVDGNAEGTTYLLDDLSIEKNVEKTWPEIANVQIHGDLLPGRNITLSYDYTNETGVQDGHTLARVLAKTADGNTTSLGCFAADSSFVVPSCAIGKELKLEILPIDRNFVCGVPVTLDVFVPDKEWTTCKLDTASYCATLEASVDETVNIYYAGYEGTKLIKTFLIQKELGAYESAMIQPPAEFSAEDVDSVKVMVFDEQYRPKCTSNTVELPKINRNPFAGDDEINVVFLGGSITYGAGASDRFTTSYASQTSAWLKETYEKDGVTVNCYNEGIGGTPSDFGLLRLNRDVTVHDPDLVFVEFAVNDGGRDTRMYMESIVRSLQAWPTNPYIIFLYTTDETYSTPTMYHEQVAEYYNIPQISLKDALKEHLNGKNAREAGYLTDSVHPSDLGYAVYYNEIVRCLKTNRFFNKPNVHKNKLMESSGSFEIAFHPIADFAVYSDDWTADRLYSKTWLKTTTIGAELNFEFDGTILVFQHGLNAASAMYEVYVDGELAGRGDPYYAGYYSNAESLGFRTFTLPNGHHSVTVKTIKSMNSASEGDQVVLYTAITGRPAS